MSNINKIDLAGDFQELTCEQAAAIQGGAQIELFVDVNFGGKFVALTADRAGDKWQLADDFNNSISSARVISGTWRLNSEPDGSGLGPILEPGDYSDFRTAFSAGNFNDVTSLVTATFA